MKKKISDALQVQADEIDTLKKEIESKNFEITNLTTELSEARSSRKEDNALSSSTSTTTVESIDVKKLLSKIYEKLVECFPQDGDDSLLNADVLKTVRQVLKQVASEEKDA